MGTIKDAIDLLLDLHGRVQDRKIAAEILSIQSLISAVQSENPELLEKNTAITKENLDLQSENFELKRKINDLESPSSFSVGVSYR